MSSVTGMHGRTATVAWPRFELHRIQRALANEIAIIHTSLAADRAYSNARSDAGRRQVLADFLESLR